MESREARYIFAGNRFYVLEAMLQNGLHVERIFAVAQSWLEKELIRRSIAYETLPEKQVFVRLLESLSFDYLVSNGLPYILPVSRLQQNNRKRFLNVHPSYLPDLKGPDPQPGAILLARDSGAACHYMNDSIDAGPIISRKKITYDPKWDAPLLYRLTFMAEQEVFMEALKKNFVPLQNLPVQPDACYYAFRPSDLRIDFNGNAAAIIRTVKAFNTPRKGARFIWDNIVYTVRDAEFLRHPYLSDVFFDAEENQLVMCYEENLLVKKGDGFLALKFVQGVKEHPLREGLILTTEETMEGRAHALV